MYVYVMLLTATRCQLFSIKKLYINIYIYISVYLPCRQRSSLISYFNMYINSSKAR